MVDAAEKNTFELTFELANQCFKFVRIRMITRYYKVLENKVNYYYIEYTWN